MSGLLENKTFKAKEHLGDNHVVSRISDIAIRLDDNRNNSFLKKVITMLRSEDKDWVSKNMETIFDRESFERDVKIISEDYPLLMNIPVYSYGSMTENDLRENIIGYIKMCDQLANNEMAVKKTA